MDTHGATKYPNSKLLLPSADWGGGSIRIAALLDIAAVVHFLVGPDGGWINGSVVRRNGGMI
jgi:hypothetical protein